MQPQISFLSPEEQEHIHRSALWLLENVGMRFPSREAVDIMRNAGARIEGENIVKIPAELVAYAVEKAPKREGFVLYGREEKYDIHFGSDTPVLSSMGGATDVIDLDTGERRPASTKDIADMVRLQDALDNIRINGSITSNPVDVPKETSAWYSLATAIKNTSKPVHTPTPGAPFVRDAIKMASLAAGSEEKFKKRPFVFFWILIQCPFQIDRLSLEGLIELSRQNIPVMVSSGPILGMTSPITLAGTITQVHAEVMSFLVLSQLVRPGAPFMYTSVARGFDMTTISVAMSSPEFAILRGATGQMGRYLGLPVWMPALLRDAKILDAQAGFESGTVGLVSALSADVVFGLQYDMDTLVDFADLVFSDEAMGALKRIARGFSIDKNTLALDVMSEVGHGGSFLSSRHTRENFRKEIWVPHLMERRGWPQWEKDGKKDLAQRAREKAREILAGHHPEKLAPEVETEIDQIASKSKIDYAKSI